MVITDDKDLKQRLEGRFKRDRLSLRIISQEQDGGIFLVRSSKVQRGFDTLGEKVAIEFRHR